MRCPECNQRNSVAAKRCVACETTLRRRPLPLSFKVFLGAFIGIILVCWLTAVSSTFNNPEKKLSDTARDLTGKSKSAEQMMGNLKSFDQAMRRFLQKYGSLNNNELAGKLATCLPKTLYESHVFEILPNLKLVEIDTVLNASNYLVLLSNKQVEVLPVIGLDVYDSNSFLPQTNRVDNKKPSEGQLLVLLGHTASMHGHKPRVKVLLLSSTLQSDNIVDMTDSVVPKFYGEGTAKFAPNQKDIDLSISLFSRGQELNAFCMEQRRSSLPLDDELLYEQLIWQNNSYSMRARPSTSKLFALYAAANCIKDHSRLSSFKNLLSPQAYRTIEQAQMVKNDLGLNIEPYKSGKRNGVISNIYVLQNDYLKAIVEVRSNAHRASGWYVNSLSIEKRQPSAVVTSSPVKNEAPAVSEKPTGQPVVEPIPTQQKEQTKRIAESTVEKNIDSATNLNTYQAQQSTNKKDTASLPSGVDAGISAKFASDLYSNIKIRSGPGMQYESIHEAAPGKTFTIIGKENGWYRVKIDDKEGYIYAGFVKKRADLPYRSATVKRSCNVRGEEHKIISVVKTGEHVLIISGPRNSRYKIMLADGKTGFVTQQALDGTTAVESPPPSVP